MFKTIRFFKVIPYLGEISAPILKNEKLQVKLQSTTLSTSFKKLGTVENLPSTGRKKTATTYNKIDEVCDLIKNKLGMIVRRVAVASNISKSSVQRINKSVLNFYPYKIKLIHEHQIITNE